MKRRVVITGLGAVTPVGVGVKAFWRALRDGVPGITRITLFDAVPYYYQVAAEVKDFDHQRDFISRGTRHAILNPAVRGGNGVGGGCGARAVRTPRHSDDGDIMTGED